MLPFAKPFVGGADVGVVVAPGDGNGIGFVVGVLVAPIDSSSLAILLQVSK